MVEELLKSIWPIVEQYGVPVLAAAILLTWVSLGLYLRECHQLRQMEKLLKKGLPLQGNIKNSYEPSGLPDLFYAFKNFSTINPEFLAHPVFARQIENINYFRTFYRLMIPAILIIGSLGILINEFIIDK